MSDPRNPSLPLLMKLGSIIVHVDEWFSEDGRDVDKVVVLRAIDDPEVKQWIKDMGALLPLKRRHHG